MVDYTKPDKNAEPVKQKVNKNFVKKIMSNKKQLVIILTVFAFQFIFMAVYVAYRPGFLKVKGAPQQLAELNSKFDSNFEKLFKRLDKQDSTLKEYSYTMQRVPRIFPIPNARITSTYGMRDSVMHWGIDIAAKKGTPIYSAASGKVIKAKYEKGYGNITIIDTGLFTYKIAHQDSMFVKEGQDVFQGQLIGTVGNTGRSTGAHEHIEFEQDGKHRDPIIFFP